MIRLATFLLLLLPLPGPSQDPTSFDTAAVKKLITSYFAKDADKSHVLSELEKFGPIPQKNLKDIVKHSFQQIRRGSRCGGKSPCTLQDPEETGTYLIQGARRGRLQPLVIALHGGSFGVTGNAPNAMAKWASAGCIVVAPNQPTERERAWTRPGGFAYVKAIIEEVKRTYAVDTNRIYLVGHSFGGFGTWSIGTSHPDLFAALSGVACFPQGDVTNLRNTPIYWYWSTDDPHRNEGGINGTDHNRETNQKLDKLKKEHGGYRHQYKEYDNIGHGVAPGGHGSILKWLLANKRDPYPKKIVSNVNAFWFRGRGKAEYKGNNSFTVEGGSILISEKMINLKKPVKVNGKEVEIELNLRILIESVDFYRDKNLYFVGRVK